MPSLEMGKEMYLLNKEVIESLIGDGLIGNYALGSKSNNGSFIVHYVGRSDTDLKQRLIQHLSDKNPYPFFKFSIAANIKEAYLKECKNYHDFGAEEYLENEIHPAKPDGLKISCPYCDK